MTPLSQPCLLEFSVYRAGAPPADTVWVSPGIHRAHQWKEGVHTTHNYTVDLIASGNGHSSNPNNNFKGPITSIAATGNNIRHFVPEGFCHLLTPGDLNGTGTQGQTILSSFLSCRTTWSSNLPLKTFGFCTLDWVGNSPTGPGVSTPLYHRRRKGTFSCLMSFLLQLLPLWFDNRCHISVPFIHKAL